MTTAAEIKQIVGSYPAEAQRVVLQPSALLLSDEGKDKLAKEVVALANRDGGRLVLGVDAHGRFEEPLAITGEPAVAAIEELVTSRTVPRVEASLEHLTGEDGDLLVVRVPRRVGSPHAFARVTARGSVAGRVYLVRHGAQTRPVSDAQLTWMFRVADDPAVRRSFPLILYTRPGGMQLADDLPQPSAADRFAAWTDMLDSEHQAVLAAEAATRANAFVELAGWAFLREIGDLLHESDVPYEEVPVDELPVPVSGSVFGAAPGGLRTLLGGTPPASGLRALLPRKRSTAGFALPLGSELQVDYLARQRKARLMLTHPAFVITFTALPGDVGEGLDWPGHEGQLADRFGWTRLQLEYACSLPFPTEASASPELEGWLERLQRRLESGWSSDRFQGSISARYLRRIADGLVADDHQGV